VCATGQQRKGSWPTTIKPTACTDIKPEWVTMAALLREQVSRETQHTVYGIPDSSVNHRIYLFKIPQLCGDVTMDRCTNTNISHYK
jgi:hypothetical protein